MSRISPSLLSADFSILKEEIDSVNLSSSLHYDVMDGQFVSNISFGHFILKDVRKHYHGLIYAHLMTLTPFKHLEKYYDAGADHVIIHLEAADEYELELFLKNRTKPFGLSINPETDVALLRKYLNLVDSVLLMSVNPGLGGQKLLVSVYPKISFLKDIKETEKLNFEIIVDGGVNFDNIDTLLKIGVDTVVMGSALFSQKERNKLISKYSKQKIYCIKFM